MSLSNSLEAAFDGARPWLFVATLLLSGCKSSGASKSPNATAVVPPPSRSGHERMLSLNQPPPSTVEIDADPERTGWYPNQPRLDPGIVTSSDFGRIFKTALPLSPGEQVFAQPLVVGDGVFVVTEANDVYALDALTGAVTASRQLGAPWNANDIGCGDLTPSVGVTGTPVIDTTSRTAFFFAKTYRDGTQGPDRSDAVWYAHAVDIDTLDERPNFPVEIKGAASNDPAVVFDPYSEMQRTGLLLMDGVVYAGFGGHCDFDDYHGWVVGIGEAGDVRAMFATEAGPDSVRGAGIWQSGGGLMSDGSGRIFFTSGNGYSDSIFTPTPGNTPPPALDESVVRLAVQADGTLSAVDFFTPYDVAYLDSADLDFGSGSIVALPDDTFGNTAHPHLALAAGKEGIMYLLDRDNLGGFKQGVGGGDAAVSQVVVEGGLWSRPAVWSGNGGMAYVVPSNGPLQSFQYGNGADGLPAFTFTGSSTEPLAYSSGSPVITSNGTRADTALVWLTYTTGGYGSGSLRAYDALPDASGHLTLRFDDAYGGQSKFSRPAVGAGCVYVGTADGYVLGYGSPSKGPLLARAVDFGAVIAGSPTEKSVLVHARSATTVRTISSTDGVFTVVSTTPKLPAKLNAGDALTISTSFSPKAAEPYVASLSVGTDAGAASISLHGIGQSRGPSLSVAASGLSFGGLPIGGSRSTNLLLTNSGSQPLTFSEIDVPHPPFSIAGAPAAGSTLAPGQSVTLTVTFAPTDMGTFGDGVAVFSNGGSAMVMLSGTSSNSGQLDIEPVSIDFGELATGQTSTSSFTVHNIGNTDVTITKSKTPSHGTFTATSSLDEGTLVPAGATVVETVSFAPTAEGTFADEWILDASDGGGARAVAFTGTAVAGSMSATSAQSQ
ncbi:MAG TPA: choice-of-anchor D domain-containing protein [Polyangiaceae bacterium]|nr:choice-of-anchor D domain-containing protein [Polyangiaceae bacterium]